VIAADGILQRGGDKGLDQGRPRTARRRQPAELLVATDAVVREERPDLVSGQQFHLAGAVAHRHAHTIAVRIGREHDIDPLLIRQPDGQRQRLGIFGIGRLHRREPGVERRLRRHLVHLNPRAPQQRQRGDAPRAMNVGEDHAQWRALEKGRIDRRLGRRGEVGLVGVGSEDRHAGQRLLKVAADFVSAAPRSLP
jgi:hypothetical protein